VSARATVSVHNLEIDDATAHLHDLGFQYVTSAFASLVDCSERDSFCRLLTDDEVERYRERMIDLAGYVVRNVRSSRPIWVTDLVYYVNALHDLHPRHSSCGAGRIMTAVSPDGKLYPCSRFAGLPEYALGDVYTGWQRPAPFDGDSVSREECHSCWARYLCGGGCWADVLLAVDQNYSRLQCRLWQYKLEAAIWLYYRLKQLSEDVFEGYRSQVEDQVEHLTRI
jgi:uncharacterized protein